MALSGSLRCKSCHTNWPRLLEDGKPVFNPCMECVEKDRDAACDMVNTEPIPLDEAWSRKKHAAFEIFCKAEWTDERREAYRQSVADEAAKMLHADLDAFTSSAAKEDDRQAA